MTDRWSGFADRIVLWQERAGRTGLPWQGTRDPYRVWLSEIMLQQTQVSTVLDYFPRFVERFPDVQRLAAASLDDVFGLWSGLGYYSRARNLHRCAVHVVEAHGGRFPESARALETLPGIGRSTAAAIAAFCFGERAAILDGNVKRVLTRVLGFDGDLAQVSNEKILWTRAEALLPTHAPQTSMPRYTQGLMDLGASLCRRRDPRCGECPVAEICVGAIEGRANSLPVRTRTLKRKTESHWLLFAYGPGGEVWLVKRPARGIWAGLYCVPVFPGRSELESALDFSTPAVVRDGAVVSHSLTHRELLLHPVEAHFSSRVALGEGGWFDASQWVQLGLPAPVRRLLSAADVNRFRGDA
jgi:A/G-specific adenine glycosylase